MCELMLVRPSKQYAEQVMSYKEEMLRCGDSFDGCAGLASEMLRLVLPFCREFGESKVLLTCDKENVASQRTIIKNGGVIENEIADTVGLSKSGIIQRFWISI